MEDIQEILEDFLVEAFELIEQLDQNLVELEARPDGQPGCRFVMQLPSA